MVYLLFLQVRISVFENNTHHLCGHRIVSPQLPVHHSVRVDTDLAMVRLARCLSTTTWWRREPLSDCFTLDGTV